MQRDMGNTPSLAKVGAAVNARITCENLACVRGDRMLFRALDMTCAAGEAVHVTGANGTGKSSFLRVLAGLLRPYAGSVETKGKLALSDERLALDMHWTLARALDFWAGLDGTRVNCVTDALSATGLADLADVPLRYFSTGQRKRASLVQVMASGASVWLLDEPANGLDAKSVGLLEQIMRVHLARGGVIIAASHQPLPLENAMVLPLESYVA